MSLVVFHMLSLDIRYAFVVICSCSKVVDDFCMLALGSCIVAIALPHIRLCSNWSRDRAKSPELTAMYDREESSPHRKHYEYR